MKTVWKFAVPIDDEWHDWPFPADQIVHVDVQSPAPDAAVMVWVEMSVDEPEVVPTTTLRVFGTGHPVPDWALHVGSVVTAGGGLVWHLYLAGEERP